MRAKEIELSAAKNAPLPEYPNAAEMCLHVALRAIYKEYRSGSISREQAQGEKLKIIGKCREYENDILADRECCSCHQQNIRKAGTLLTDIQKTRDVQEIAVRACEAISLMTGDELFSKLQKAKIYGCEIHEIHKYEENKNGNGNQ